MKVKDIRDSQFLHELAGGVRVKLTTYRRGTDQQLFDRYYSLYDFVDKPGIKAKVAQATRWYPYTGEAIDTYFVIKHETRIAINARENSRLAEKQAQKLFLPSPGHVHGATHQPQDVFVWPGLEMMCSTRKQQSRTVVNGAVYIVESWTDTHVKVRLHSDYISRFKVEDLRAEEAEAAEESDEENEEEDEDLEVVEVDPEPDNEHVFSLTHETAARVLRVQHALVYASIQGRTMRDKHLGLLDTDKSIFTKH